MEDPNKADHPRIRGEHESAINQAEKSKGSSPHTRGARQVVGTGWGPLRIIPAYAGSTWIIVTRQAPARDHPRIRGEHDGHGRQADAQTGSSPHTRGALADGALTQMSIGDHPRIRGEHQEALVGILGHAGSSPHTRGARRAAPAEGEFHGIIPAYAGSTLVTIGKSMLPRDHPRIRGEHQAALALLARMLGSSPHTRGAPGLTPAGRRLGRIIPAYAGSTGRSSCRRARPGDHPRIRGEHSALLQSVAGYQGSSPHTRGARCRARAGRGPGGIIPAYAGSTLPRRICSNTIMGSSPHTRGAPGRLRRLGAGRGIIPAYAGSTGGGGWRLPDRTDHPRIRGEHPIEIDSLSTEKGSSPHTRGAQP